MDSPELVEDWQVCYYSSKSSPLHYTTIWPRLTLGLVYQCLQDLKKETETILTLSNWRSEDIVRLIVTN